MTKAVGGTTGPVTRWIHMVSTASARVIAGSGVVSCRASIDVPAPGGPRKLAFDSFGCGR
jgi:hypothetical protein